jgi:hypothetical protein
VCRLTCAGGASRRCCLHSCHMLVARPCHDGGNTHEPLRCVCAWRAVQATSGTCPSRPICEQSSALNRSAQWTSPSTCKCASCWRLPSGQRKSRATCPPSRAWRSAMLPRGRQRGRCIWPGWLLAAGCWLLAAGCWLLAGWLSAPRPARCVIDQQRTQVRGVAPCCLLPAGACDARTAQTLHVRSDMQRGGGLSLHTWPVDRDVWPICAAGQGKRGPQPVPQLHTHRPAAGLKQRLLASGVLLPAGLVKHPPAFVQRLAGWCWLRCSLCMQTCRLAALQGISFPVTLDVPFTPFGKAMAARREICERLRQQLAATAASGTGGGLIANMVQATDPVTGVGRATGCITVRSCCGHVLRHVHGVRVHAQ